MTLVVAYITCLTVDLCKYNYLYNCFHITVHLYTITCMNILYVNLYLNMGNISLSTCVKFIYITQALFCIPCAEKDSKSLCIIN